MELSYGVVGRTAVAQPGWSPPVGGFRAYESSVRIGAGPAAWQEATAAVMTWGVKTRSGFEVHAVDGGEPRVRLDADYTLVARVGAFRIREPVRVVDVVQTDDRCGFAYGTGVGHPVSGEEAFIVWRDPQGRVWLTLRSLTRPSTGLWRLLFPVLLVAQRWYRCRYQRALRPVTRRRTRCLPGRA
ncbi:MAG TPA: DUF1990 domain-containing protein [Nocardioides sp.]|nr:DUF1990 domain-containing protein [Nocardioides sp.]